MNTLSQQFTLLLPGMLRNTIRVIAARMDKEHLGITIPQAGILDFLLSHDEAVQTDLAQHFAKDKSVMLRTIDEMEKAGWVERQMDPVDRRRKNLVVTKAGQALHKKVVQVRAKAFAEVLEGVAEKDMATCLRVLASMNDNALRIRKQ